MTLQSEFGMALLELSRSLVFSIRYKTLKKYHVVRLEQNVITKYID
jgi:hypothetical protein